MSIVSDLKENEYEVTIDCPVVGCPAKTTCAFDLIAKTKPKEVNRKMLEVIMRSHQEGRHNVEAFTK